MLIHNWQQACKTRGIEMHSMKFTDDIRFLWKIKIPLWRLVKAKYAMFAATQPKEHRISICNSEEVGRKVRPIQSCKVFDQS